MSIKFLCFIANAVQNRVDTDQNCLSTNWKYLWAFWRLVLWFRRSMGLVFHNGNLERRASLRSESETDRSEWFLRVDAFIPLLFSHRCLKDSHALFVSAHLNIPPIRYQISNCPWQFRAPPPGSILLPAVSMTQMRELPLTGVCEPCSHCATTLPQNGSAASCLCWSAFSYCL